MRVEGRVKKVPKPACVLNQCPLKVFKLFGDIFHVEFFFLVFFGEMAENFASFKITFYTVLASFFRGK